MAAPAESKIIDLPASNRNYGVASRAVLRTPVYAAVLRGVISPRERKRLQGQSREEKVAAARGLIDTLPRITNEVTTFMASHPLANYVKLDMFDANVPMRDGGIASGSLTEHYDNVARTVPRDAKEGSQSLLGPLGFSVRIDDLACRRIFTVHRPPVPTLVLDENKQLRVTREVYGWTAAGVTERIEQAPGDLIIIGNEPQATRHSIHEEWDGEPPTGITEALVVQYMLRAA